MVAGDFDKAAALPLRAQFPELYNLVTERLEQAGLQPYDIRAEVMRAQEDGSFTLFFYYGSQLNELLTFSMGDGGIGLDNPELLSFVDGLVKACRDVAVADYRKFMDPSSDFGRRAQQP